MDDAVAVDDLLDSQQDTPLNRATVPVSLQGYGCRWFRVRRMGQRVSP
jgi:hypothetical protein